jgi:PAS domain S-box-containing protein
MTQGAAGYVPELPESFEIVDDETLARANEVLDFLATGLFPDGNLSTELLTWSERMLSPGTASTHVLSIEERLKAAEARFVTLVQQIPAVTFMAVLGEGENDVYVSPHIEQMLGYSQEQWLSEPFLWYYRLHPEDRDAWNAEFARGVRTGGPFRAECRFIARDGRTVWVHGEARLVRDDLAICFETGERHVAKLIGDCTYRNRERVCEDQVAANAIEHQRAGNWSPTGLIECSTRCRACTLDLTCGFALGDANHRSLGNAARVIELALGTTRERARILYSPLLVSSPAS